MIRTNYKTQLVKESFSPYEHLLYVQDLLNCGEFKQAGQSLKGLHEQYDVTKPEDFLESYIDFRLNLIDDEEGEKTPELILQIREDLKLKPRKQKILDNIQQSLDYLLSDAEAVGIDVKEW